MTWVAVAVGGGAIVGGLLSGSASKSAAKTQANAANQATQAQLQMYGQTQGNLQPFLTAGQTSLADLGYFMGLGGPGFAPANDQFVTALNAAGYDKPTGPGGTLKGFGAGMQPFGLEQFQASPAYQFNLEQGQRAIDKGAAARGNFYAPQTLQDLSKFSQGLASNEFQNAFQNYNTTQGNLYNRLFGVAGAGQNAAVQQGGFGAGAANQIGANSIFAGSAQAAGTMGQANAYGGAIDNAALMSQMLSRNQAPSVNPGIGYGSAGSYDPYAGLFGGGGPG